MTEKKTKKTRKGRKKSQPRIRHEAFARAYVYNGGDAKAAAIEAGYSESYAKGNGYSLVHNKYVKGFINRYRRQRDDEFNLSITDKKEFLLRVINAGLALYVDGNGSQRPENLAAVNSAIAEMNKMDGDYKPVQVQQDIVSEVSGSVSHSLSIDEATQILVDAGIDPDSLV